MIGRPGGSVARRTSAMAPPMSGWLAAMRPAPPTTMPAASASTCGGAKPPASRREISSTIARKMSRPTTVESHGSPRSVTPTTIGARIPALIRRVESIGSSCAVAALALSELLDGGVEVSLREVRPQRVREDELGIGPLPQQEVAGALLATGSDDQVRVGLTGGVELLVEAMLVDLVGGNAGSDERARGVDDLGPPGVVEGDVERHA